MAKKEYLTFVDRKESLTEGKEIELLIKDLTPGRTKYDSRYVRAIVHHNPLKIPDGEVLWIRGLIGLLYPKPYAIKIVKEVGEFPSIPLK